MNGSDGTEGNSPASTGPAGAQFEAQVGAHYLLTLLTNAEPRGLPGTSIERIALQRAGEGRALDDVIVHARNLSDNPAVLEIQVKREITFSPSDPVFEDVVHQIARASQRSDFWTSNYQLGIATAKISRRIAGSYQDVLKWARELESAQVFFERLNRPRAANDEMRSFVRTFRAQLSAAGAVSHDETVWGLLRRLQILVFDFTAEGSASAELARERAVHALHEQDGSDATKLWSMLIERAIDIAASGGARTRVELQEELRTRGFRLAGDRRHAPARAALSEASQTALAHIDDRIGNVTLSRPERLAAIHAALDQGRYVEIRGDAGVGKSGLLKHFALQVAAESRVVVVSPGHVIPQGWIAMRSMLGFDGTIHEFLTDVASAGAAMLFIDNVDFFTEDERRTVVDLIEAVANVPGFAVVVTARRQPEEDAVNWLPQDSLDRLGRASPVVVDELSATEIADLQDAAPEIGALLIDSHPARDVARNLFRLSRLLRLAGSGGETRALRTEIDTAMQWWDGADGQRDDLHRDRSRLLRLMADRTLSGSGPVDVSDQSSQAVNALIRSETLRELRPDHVVFRHDVLAEWAIALFLSSDATAIGRLPLAEPSPPRLARGVELAARIALERTADTVQWEALLARVSEQAIHRSWRRAVLLAIVRSEAGLALLSRASTLLAANNAALLKELVRTVMAVDVRPVSELLAASGVDPRVIPANIDIPSGWSWVRLIGWLLTLRENLPVHAIPDVVDLYTGWSVGHLGNDALTPALLAWLHHWLVQIEDSRDGDEPWDRPAPFGGQLGGLNTLETNLRNGFLLFCDKTPELAVRYLRSVMARSRRGETMRRLLKFRGALAKAAPAELADLTAAALIPDPTREESDGHERRLRGPFEYLDHEFIPAAPGQGPFFELLTHAPEHGLRLIRRLVDASIAFYRGGREPGDDALTVSLAGEQRVFPWIRSYNWSREGSDAPYTVASGLLALEAWAHGRIEGGQDFDAVLRDVLGSPGAPACYLLVAVDLLLSHWPSSSKAAVGFLGCPELLCLDRQRQLHDQMGLPDIFGLKELQKEPVGGATLASLTVRPSRHNALEALLPFYAFQSAELREQLVDILRRASERLGAPDADATLGDASLMAVHALNLIEPANYREETSTRNDGSTAHGWRYVPPDTERSHFEGLQQRAKPRHETANMQAAISVALEDRSRSSAAFAAAAVAWVQGQPPRPEDDDDTWMQEQAVIITAMIAMRDGDSDLRAKSYDWAQGVFAGALSSEDDPVHQSRQGLRFNPIAIAFVGMTHALAERHGPPELRSLLRASFRPAAVHGFIAEAPSLAARDERLPRALLRCALTRNVYRVRQWDDPDSETRIAAFREQRQAAALEAELAWLAEEGPEPPWPTLPLEDPVPKKGPIVGRRRGIRLDEQREEPPEERFNSQMGALWLQGVKRLIAPTERPWVFDLVRAYADWTWNSNGAGLERTESVSGPPREWNDAYFDLLAHCLPGQSQEQIDALVLVPMCALPDDSFLEVAPPFLRAVDDVYFNDHGIDASIAVYIRTTIAQHLVTTNSWHWLSRRRDSSIGMHIAPLIATCFFNNYGHGLTPSKAYLLPKGIERVGIFLAALEPLVAGAPCHFIAAVTLNLLEVAPSPEHLPFLVTAAGHWLLAHPDSKDFWIEHGFGQRVCGLVDTAWNAKADALSAGHPIRKTVNGLLAALVQIGVAEAARLERVLLSSDPL